MCSDRPGLPVRVFSAVVVIFGVLSPLPLVPSVARLPAGAGQSSARQEQFFRALVAAAVERTHHIVRYDSAYLRIPYPGGDVPANTGVCTDEVIRTYRAVGIDLQKAVHEDMLAHLSDYPKKWASAHAAATDTNIDHRRVPNLMVFFRRNGTNLMISSSAADYRPGDLVTWNLGGGITHIGIVVDRGSPDGEIFMIVHNIGQGAQVEDVLFHWKIIGHYRYGGKVRGTN